MSYLFNIFRPQLPKGNKLETKPRIRGDYCIMNAYFIYTPTISKLTYSNKKKTESQYDYLNLYKNYPKFNKKEEVKIANKIWGKEKVIGQTTIKIKLMGKNKNKNKKKEKVIGEIPILNSHTSCNN